MRQRPKQANYLEKFGERKEVAVKGINQVRKEKAKAQGAKNSSALAFAKRGKTNLIENRHITPTSAQDYGWVQQEDNEGLNEGSKVSILRSLDDIPDGLPATSIHDENQRYTAPEPAPSRRVLSLDDMGGGDNYWAQPSPKVKQIKSEFIEQQQSPRVVVHSKPGSDWGLERADGVDPYNNVSALTSLDDFPDDGHIASPRYEDVRGEHVPSGHNRAIRQQQGGGGGVINQIAKMPTMQRMQPMGAAPVAVDVDHGFSPPRRAQPQPLSAREYKREYSPVEVPPLPVQQAKRLPDFPSKGPESGRGGGSNPSSGRGGPPPSLHNQFGKFRRGNFSGHEDDDYEDLEADSMMDPPSARSGGRNHPPSGRKASPRSPRSLRQQRRPQQQQPPDAFDFDEDSEGEPPSYMNDYGGGYGGSPNRKKPVPGPYNQRVLSVGVNSPPKISMVSTAAPALPCEKPEVPEDQKLYYSKAPRHVDYVPGTLKDYKASQPKEYQEIPKKLKPDLNSDTLKAKRANKERVKEFSENLKKYNRAEIEAHKKLPSSVESRDLELSTNKQMSKRERALQYGKNVPKPKASSDASTITSTGASGQSKAGGGGRNRGNFESKLDVIYDEDDWNAKDDMADDEFLEAPDPSGMAFSAANKLSELEAKHNNSKRQIDAIKRSLKM